MRVPSLSAALFALSLAACGSAPPTVEATPDAPPEAPAPDEANPCDAVSIDPAENPCAGLAADAAKAEGEAAAADGEKTAEDGEKKADDGEKKAAPDAQAPAEGAAPAEGETKDADGSD